MKRQNRVAATLVCGTALATLLVVVARAQGLPGGFAQAWGSRYGYPETADLSAHALSPQAAAAAADRLHHWNQIAIDSTGLDHTPVLGGDARVFGEQFGPGRASRALAIVHIAMFDAVNAIAHRYKGYTGIADAPPGASMDAAIAQAAHDTLVDLYPSQRAQCDRQLADDLVQVPDGDAKQAGIDVGQRAAREILRLRADDGANHGEPLMGTEFVPGAEPGRWRQDPISEVPIALGAYWGRVRPFVLPSAEAFRVPPPPALDSPEYAAAFDEVKRLGGDGETTPTERTEEQTLVGIYWAYDGTPSLGPPPRMYNQIAVQIGDQLGTDLVDLSRLLALVNVAMADGAIASWESKFHYQYWRPVTAIREADAGSGPTGAGDGNPATTGDPAFTPLGAPASNLAGPNFTPPFPAYPSGHATFGGAVFQVLREMYGTDAVPFTFVSDEMNGITRDRLEVVRPLTPRSFTTLSQAEEENGQSRVYLGIHWAFDKTAGIEQGHRIADYIFRNAFVPR